MDKKSLACFYYPTTVVCIDDDPHFLDMICLQLGDRAFCETFTGVSDAISFIEDPNRQNKILADTIKPDTGSNNYQHDSAQLPLQFDISGLHKAAYDPELHKEISVVVVDYSMPTMNGDEFCRKLADLPVKKIMLTGEADQNLAVELFNEGIIDKFLLKNDPKLGDKLCKDVLELQKQYFQDLTFPVIKGLSTDDDSALSDPAYVTLFENTFKKLNVSSFYLVDPQGSFLLIDGKGDVTYLIIKTLSELSELASEVDSIDGDSGVSEPIRAGKVIPYCLDSDLYSLATSGDNLEPYLYETEALKGNKDYAYALVQSLKGFEFDPAKVVAFDKQIVGL